MISVLVEASVRALLVAMTVWAGLRVLRVTNVLAQKAAWGMVLVASAAMPLIVAMPMRWQTLPASLTVRVPAVLARGAQASRDGAPLAGFADARVAARQRAVAHAPGRVARVIGHVPPAAISNGPVTSVRESSAAAFPMQKAAPRSGWGMREIFARLLQPAALAGLTYLAVALLLFGRMVVGLAIAMRLWFVAEPFVAEQGPEGEADPCAGLRLRFSAAVSSPVTIGSGVLLPAECLGWDRAKLRIVLAHERAHVRHGDFYLQLLASLYSAVFWFSPLGWWLKRTLCDLAEAISDCAGLQEAASRATYAQVLLEFAALPHPTAIGVAMARTNNLSHRIERLLNEASFRQAFAGGRRRIVIAILLVPVALFGATALIRVEAAGAQQVAPVPAAPATPPSPAAEPPAADLGSEPAAAAAPAPAVVAPVPPVPPAPAYGVGSYSSNDLARAVQYLRYAQDASHYAVSYGGSGQSAGGDGTSYGSSTGFGYTMSQDDHGDSYALVSEQGKNTAFSGEWNDSMKGTIERARKMAHGKFLVFTRNGKSYVVDDAALINQIEAMYAPMEALGKMQGDLGRQQEVLGAEQEKLGRRQEQASIPTPDISKEMARLNEAVARLNAKKGSTVSQEELADLEGRLGEIQGRIGELQGEVASKQGDLGEQQGKLGEEQGKLGEQQGKLGEKQAKLAEDVNRKVKVIIDQTLQNGKARPVD